MFVTVVACTLLAQATSACGRTVDCGGIFLGRLFAHCLGYYGPSVSEFLANDPTASDLAGLLTSNNGQALLRSTGSALQQLRVVVLTGQ